MDDIQVLAQPPRNCLSHHHHFCRHQSRYYRIEVIKICKIMAAARYGKLASKRTSCWLTKLKWLDLSQCSCFLALFSTRPSAGAYFSKKVNKTETGRPKEQRQERWTQIESLYTERNSRCSRKVSCLLRSKFCLWKAYGSINNIWPSGKNTTFWWMMMTKTFGTWDDHQKLHHNKKGNHLPFWWK